MSKPVSLRLPDDLLTSLDGARGDTSRSEWIVGAIEARLAPAQTHDLELTTKSVPDEMIRRLTERAATAEQKARDLEAQLHIERAQIVAPINEAERIGTALRGGPVNSLQAKAGVMPIERTGKRK